MSDPRFFRNKGPFTAAHLASAIGGELRGDGDIVVTDVSPLSVAGAGHCSFLDNRKYLDDLAVTKAAVIILAPHIAEIAPTTATLIVHDEPYKAYARIAQLFYPVLNVDPAFISPHAIIHPTAVLGPDCTVEAGAVIEAGARLGRNVRIAANAVIGPNVEIGHDSLVGYCASVSHSIIGERVRILPGVRIGQEGFGFAIDPTGHIRIPQLGRVIIEDDVEIGANSTIDRGSGPDTIIRRGAMIDNLVQIAHNVHIGQGSILVAQCGIAGSSHLDVGVVVGGQVGIAGHLKIGKGVQIGGQTGVMRDIEPGKRVMGYPHTTTKQFFRQVAWLERAASDKNETQE